MIFSKAKNKPDKPKGRSTLGVLFNPDIGGTLRPLGESTAAFVNLLAMVFATQGLFPRNHPALTGGQGAPRLTLTSVIGTAWGNLKFTKQTIPQIILFFAVVSILVVSTVAFFIVLASMFIGKAHAQTCDGTGFFSPCNADYDIAVNWLNYLFNDVPLNTAYVSSYGGNTGQVLPTSFAVQDALKAALGFYSDAIMVVAAIILFYHLIAMIVNTAHHGVVMGKQANQIWAPIRLVFAVGLLIPLGGGLNTGQYLVIAVAEWGSNMAGHVWSTFVSSMAADATCQAGGVNQDGSPAPGQGSGCGVVGVMPIARKAVYDTLMTQACVAAYNARVNGAAGSTSGSTPGTPYQAGPPQVAGTPTIPGTIYSQYTDPGGDNTCSPLPMNTKVNGAGGDYPPIGGILTTAADGSNIVSFNLPKGQQLLSQKDMCGYFKFPAPQPIDSNDAIQVAVQSAVNTTGAQAFNDMVTSVQGFVTLNLPYFLPSCLGGKADQAMLPNTGALEDITAQYQSALQTGFTNTAQAFADQLKQVALVSSSQGWVSAGAWFNTISREQGALMDIASAIPATQGPNENYIGDSKTGLYDAYVTPVLGAFQLWVGAPDTVDSITGGSTLDSQQQQMELASAGFAQTGGDEKAHVMDVVFAEIDFLASYNKMWHSDYNSIGGGLTPQTSIKPGSFQLGVQFNGANPLAEIAAFGHNCIEAAYQLFDTYIGMTFVGNVMDASGDAMQKQNSPDARGNWSKDQKQGVAGVLSPIASVLKLGGTAAAAVGSIFGLASFTFFTIGFMLAYFLPMIPFFRFLFNVVTWIVSLLEAVIAVPLFALAHLTPEGEGLAGQMARPGYFFVLAIFLRPVLMVFGLIIGLLIFYIAANYMNVLFSVAIAGSGGISHHHVTLAKFAYSLLYVVMLYILANTSFKAIGWLPDHAMSWLGQSGLQYDTDNLDKIEQYSTFAAGAMESKIGGATKGAAETAGKAIGGGATSIGGALGKGTPFGSQGGGLIGAGTAIGGALGMTSGGGNAIAKSMSDIVSKVTSSPAIQSVASATENAGTRIAGGIGSAAESAADKLGGAKPPGGNTGGSQGGATGNSGGSSGGSPGGR